jgi:class 3 adenylate cyclase
MRSEEPQRVAALPTGTVTFLFTDIEGSTQRWEQHGKAMIALVESPSPALRPLCAPD